MSPQATKLNLTKGVLAAARIDAACGVKTCTTCGVLKPLGLFLSARAGIGAVASVCKDCSRRYGQDRRVRKTETDVIFRVNKAILKRQEYGTDVCLLSEKSAYLATAHLMDEFGLMTVEDGHTFRSIFKANLPETLQKLKSRSDAHAEKVATRLAVSAERARVQADEKVAKREKARSGVRDVDLSDVALESLLYSRHRHHLKKKRSIGYTDLAFTKVNFTSITGYTPNELRQHLDKRLPAGTTWADVVSGALHIEHITPSAAFDLTTIGGIRLCYALSNLTLLASDENASKGGTYDKGTVVHFRSDPELARLFGLTE